MTENEICSHQKPALSLILPVASVVIFIFLTGTVMLQLAGWMYFRSGDENGLIKASTLDRYNSVYHYILGRYYSSDVYRQDYTKAIACYRKTIKLNPLQAGVWIDLSRIYQTEGDLVAADYSLERATRLNPGNAAILREAGIFYITNNMIDKSINAFRNYIIAAPENQAEIYDIFWKFGLGNEKIFESLVPQAYIYQKGYLDYLMRTKRHVESIKVWQAIDRDSLQKDLFIRYVNFLINNGMYQEAGNVWKEITEKIEGFKTSSDKMVSSVWNPGFEYELLNGGFDWRITEFEGVDVFIDETVKMTGQRSLGVQFDGKHNPEITIAQQIVPVQSGSLYMLRGFIKTESLTTTNGVFLQVNGHKCQELDKRSEVFSGSTFWQEASVEFRVPDNCRAIVIKFRRERSGKLDNKIEGMAWIDGITLKKM